MHNLQLASDDVYEMELPLGMSSLMALMDVDRHDLKDKPFISRMPAALSSGESIFCLLYTSDAADDLLCVDLGGRRIIKKKNNH